MSSEFWDIIMRKGTWISDEIGNLPINSSAKIILAEIDNLHKANVCKAGNSHFAKILGVSTETVSRIISKLRKLGYVNQIHFDGRVRTLEPIFGISFASPNIPNLKTAPIKLEPNGKSIQIPQKGQSRIDSRNKAVYAIQPNPLYNKKQNKEEYKIKNQNFNSQKSFEKFIDWSRKRFSGSTKQVLDALTNIESLLACDNQTIRIAWENWS